ncbi:MAG: sensor histidine kinase [Halobacterium sp.]
MSRWLQSISVFGAVFIAVALGRAAFAVVTHGSDPGVVIDFVLLSGPGVVLWYLSIWLPQTDFDPVLYPRVLTWCLGGVGVMFAFSLLRVGHPGVDVDWSLGTQAIAVAIGSLGGIAIGIREAEAITRADELADRNEKLAARESELERQNERLDEFTSIVSHDLRNPLNVAEGRLALAREERDSDHLAAVADAHDRMEALVDDLLSLAQQGETVADLDAVDVGALARSCWEGVDHGDATLETDTACGVYADRLRLRQVVQNLLRNAVDHGGDGVTVRVGALDDGDGFYVEDDGTGIPDADRDAVFDHGYTTSTDGTGFGLAIVDRIAEAHGWTVTITDSADGGARFEFRDVVFA